MYTYTRTGYAYIDPDCDGWARDDAFAEDLNDIWEEATGVERKAIARERGAVGVRDKTERYFTATEDLVYERVNADRMAAYYGPAAPRTGNDDDDIPF